MLTLRVRVSVDALMLVTCLCLMCRLIIVVHSASLSSLNLARDAWLEDYERHARQV